ncbi:MAG: glycosyltransferase family 4 protein [Planctomycetaceae bacterium]|nr:glycosyltransferase family 4 protein [Planctomycetaceae bacterium]
MPLFQHLARQLDVEIKVFYCCDWGVREYTDSGFGKSFAWDIPMLDGYESEFLPIRRRPRSLSFFEMDNPEVGSRLSEFQPDAVWVHGYTHRTSWRVLRWARGRARVLYFGDSELLSARGVGSRAMKRIVLPRYFARCDGFLTIGDNNEAYYRHYGVPAEKFHRGSFPIDVTRFREAVAGLTDDDRQQLRGTFGLSPNSLVVLFVGKLIDIKRPLDLVEAVARLTASHPRVEALVVGSGPLEASVRRRINELQLGNRIRLTGFVNQSEMPRVLWLGDVLAMCSEKDPHPLAVSESMSVGNAIVASDRVGCVGLTDSARVGENTLCYPCGDVPALADCLKRLAGDLDLLRQMQQRSRELAWTQDVTVARDAVVRFLQQRS